MKDESKANQFDEAANKAADDICDNVWIPDNEIPQFQERIAKHHADLRATYEKLVELAWAVQNHQANHGGLTTFCSWCDNIDVLLADPFVQSAIERSKG